MQRERYIVIGIAKTGTTVVASTVQNTLKIPDFVMEPADPATLDRFVDSERVVIKIIFEHWLTRLVDLEALCCPPGSIDPPTVILTVRDPRDELVSRLHYKAFDYFLRETTSMDDVEPWLEIFRRKERAPLTIGLIEMERQMIQRFRVGFSSAPTLHERFAGFIDRLRAVRPAGLFVLHYEDFIADTIDEPKLRHMLSGTRAVDENLRRVHRAGRSGEWKTFFTDEDAAEINRKFAAYLQRFGYPIEPPATAVTLSPDTGSCYVARLIAEARSALALCKQLRPADLRGRR